MSDKRPPVGGRNAQRPYPKGVARRGEILRTALDVFATEGDRKASLRKIADRVGLTDTGVLHYFGSREELFLAIIDERDQESTLAAEGAGDPLEAIVRTVQHNMGVPGLVRLYVAMAAAAPEPGHPAGPYFAHRYNRVREAIGAGIAQMQESGAARTDLDAGILARLLVAAVDGVQIQWLVDPSTDMAEVV
ncbi:MAG: TetR/AcrR family transcriptional regulator, partial [Streptomycetaceae bacterium]|nr:TetR/AcrR family transcriptional regulator [Streptomycetaceae bacterium]